MAFQNERRAFHRYGGDRFMAIVGDETVSVINISVAGVRIARPDSWPLTKGIDFVLVRTAEESGSAREIPVRGRVVGSDTDHLRISFGAVSPDLADAIDCFMDDHQAKPASTYAYSAF